MTQHNNDPSYIPIPLTVDRAQFAQVEAFLSEKNGGADIAHLSQTEPVAVYRALGDAATDWSMRWSTERYDSGSYDDLGTMMPVNAQDAAAIRMANRRQIAPPITEEPRSVDVIIAPRVQDRLKAFKDGADEKGFAIGIVRALRTPGTVALSFVVPPHDIPFSYDI